ncbi:MAG: hypothetical protein COB67_12605 [SAR324 cluster bacterium]|uniref:Response regulatory domain-containing protein n=1 Tax=SAR324 cluster bacterium TaxID=2024889 RepID=A0A2A4SRD7_9DELT|nr:MAG: hypothetical protein COB67_12605 [SAR324 cluster bacterium]
MELQLLLISIDDFPAAFDQRVRDYGFSCCYARGRLKAREILEQNEIDAIVWQYYGYSDALGRDLVETFNQYDSIPIILITDDFNELVFLKEIKGKFTTIDRNDEIQDTLDAIEKFCYQVPLSPIAQKEPSIYEIDFKHVMAPIIEGKQIQEELDSPKARSFKVLTPWVAVDSNEKKILAESYHAPPSPYFLRWIEWLKEFPNR